MHVSRTDGQTTARGSSVIAVVVADGDQGSSQRSTSQHVASSYSLLASSLPLFCFSNVSTLYLSINSRI